ncbi:hypothetical protein [Silvibacterium sp.]|uniref:hypothetical protein n=1 Tax=Silvibacterium sp. TaxID=1964179 RepID=UPI0039E27C68
MVDLSANVVTVIQKIFRESDRPAASELLRHELADNLPHMREIYDPVRFDRVRMAALKLSNGNMEKLMKAIALGKKDWRDLLMTAGLGQLDAHLDWYLSISA